MISQKELIKKRILIVGSNGMLGQRLAQHFMYKKDVELKCASFEEKSFFEEVDYSQIDISNVKQVKKLVTDFFPDFIINMMFGSEFIGLKQILGYFAVALAFFSLANAVVYYDLAIRKYRFLYVFAIISILEISLIIFYHDSLLVVVRILTGLMAMLFFGVLFVQKR